LFFAYFGDFSLHMRSFDNTTTSGLKSDVMFELRAPVFIRTWLPEPGSPCTFQIYLKSDEKWERYCGHKPKSDQAKPGVNWGACAFTNSGFIGHRAWSSFSDMWPTLRHTFGHPLYIPNLSKIGQQLRSLLWTIGISDRHRQTDIHCKWFYTVSQRTSTFYFSN